jgi:hypothetical protein
VVDADCEQVDRARGTTGRGSADVELSVPRSIKLRKLLKGGLPVQLDLPNAGTVVVLIGVTKKTARKLRIGRSATTLGGVRGNAQGGLATARPKVIKKYRRKLAKARRFTLVVVARFRSRSSGGGTVTLTVPVKR